MNSSYLFPETMLSAWVSSRLRLRFLRDKVHAEFRFEGSTCTDPVKPLEFLFEVVLDGSWDGFVIRSARCRRPEGTGGWRKMCSSQTEADFIEEVERESLFEGRSLEETLAWRPEIHPAECVCSQSSRYHKWQMVFHSIHYALGKGIPSNLDSPLPESSEERPPSRHDR